MNAAMRFIEPQVDPPTLDGVKKRLERDFCPTWRTEDKLPEAAKFFYQEAANLAAIPLKTLIMACSQVERRLEIWSAAQERERKVDQVVED
jgi:hypothetical protein